jgi:hypothetical protein
MPALRFEAALVWPKRICRVGIWQRIQRGPSIGHPSPGVSGGTNFKTLFWGLPI